MEHWKVKSGKREIIIYELSDGTCDYRYTGSDGRPQGAGWGLPRADVMAILDGLKADFPSLRRIA